jgi:hypothetical protein
MIPVLAEWMLPGASQIAQFTAFAAAQSNRPTNASSSGGTIFMGGIKMGILSQRIITKVSGPAWESLRGQFMQISRLLLAVSPAADSELVSAYVKFTIKKDSQTRILAAIWLKSSKQLIVGLALPEDYEAAGLGPALPGTMYKGLTKYFVVERGGAVPKSLPEWAGLAYQNALSTEPLATFPFVAREAIRRAG